jgi:hypothetical protein
VGRPALVATQHSGSKLASRCFLLVQVQTALNHFTLMQPQRFHAGRALKYGTVYTWLLLYCVHMESRAACGSEQVGSATACCS